jgi:16S rRNA (guanine1516-N2)-methyltransferase
VIVGVAIAEPWPEPSAAGAFIAGRARAEGPGAWPVAESVAALLAARPDVEVALEYARGRWQARLTARPEWLPLFIDFSLPRFAERALRAAGRSTPLARALGLHAKGRNQGPAKSVVDATAGLGADAYVIAWLGAETVALERDPVAFALLADALERAPSGPARDRLRLAHADSAERLPSLAPDAIYLDPMFPDDLGKTALPKKGMQMFRALIGHDVENDAALLALALACAKERVVVKRYPRAPPLAGPSPSASYASKTVRFDLYRTN